MGCEPYYILFAGVNGAGKSTLFHTGMWQHGSIESAKALPRVNPDEIAAENDWNPNDRSAQLKAGRVAVERIRQHLSCHESFNQETTLTGRSIVRNIRLAHASGYRIIMYYVGLDDPAIANERVARRDALGGHFIPPETIARRYDASLTNLSAVVPLCEEAYLYDNSNKLELEARFARGVLMYMNPFERNHAWVTRTTEALGYVEIAL